jgi:hypothetical protein
VSDNAHEETFFHHSSFSDVSGGETVYFGPLGEGSTDLIAYLQAIPGSPRILPGENPATWMLGETG